MKNYRYEIMDNINKFINVVRSTNSISPLQDSSEHIGDIFQDQSNMAAILMRRQLENGDLLMVSNVFSLDPLRLSNHSHYILYNHSRNVLFIVRHISRKIRIKNQYCDLKNASDKSLSVFLLHN